MKITVSYGKTWNLWYGTLPKFGEFSLCHEILSEAFGLSKSIRYDLKLTTRKTKLGQWVIFNKSIHFWRCDSEGFHLKTTIFPYFVSQAIELFLDTKFPCGKGKLWVEFIPSK